MAKQSPGLLAALKQIQQDYRSKVAEINQWFRSASSNADKATKAAIAQQKSLLLADVKAWLNGQQVAAKQQDAGITIPAGLSGLSSATTALTTGMPVGEMPGASADYDTGPVAHIIQSFSPSTTLPQSIQRVDNPWVLLGALGLVGLIWYSLKKK